MSKVLPTVRAPTSGERRTDVHSAIPASSATRYIQQVSKTLQEVLHLCNESKDFDKEFRLAGRLHAKLLSKDFHGSMCEEDEEEVEADEEDEQEEEKEERRGEEEEWEEKVDVMH